MHKDPGRLSIAQLLQLVSYEGNLSASQTCDIVAYYWVRKILFVAGFWKVDLGWKTLAEVHGGRRVNRHSAIGTCAPILDFL